jgi:sugar/nucleoside kinase (ribokinase family)
MRKHDIVTIGDCTIDAFLHINEAKVRKVGDRLELCFSFGDKIPYESLTIVPAGNSNNVAVGMARLGFKSAFYGSVGHDQNSHVILHQLHKEGVSNEFMSIQKGKQTNFHVVLWHNSERTILIKHQPYHYNLPAGIKNTSWIYFSSVGPKGLVLHAEVEKLLRKNPKIKMAFNPGTFQLRMGLKKLMPIMRLTEILFLNKEESEMMVGKHGGDPEKLAHALHKLGPKIVVVTDGLKGSYALANGEFYKCGIYPHIPYESTGCGDAFSTGFMAGIMHGLTPAKALLWGARNGAAVATKIGPQPGLVYKNAMIRDLKAHKNFKAKLISN